MFSIFLYFSINRTTLELKRKYCKVSEFEVPAINRTTLELKLEEHTMVNTDVLLSIEPHWN